MQRDQYILYSIIVACYSENKTVRIRQRKYYLEIFFSYIKYLYLCDKTTGFLFYIYLFSFFIYILLYLNNIQKLYIILVLQQMSESLIENFELQMGTIHSPIVLMQYDVEPTSPLFIPVSQNYFIEDSIFNFQPVTDHFLEYNPLPVLEAIPSQPSSIEGLNINFSYQISIDNIRFRRPLPQAHKSTKAEIKECIKGKIQSKKYQKKQKITDTDENKQCCICLNEFKSNRPLGVLKCGHEFHKTCITKWINKKYACPLCRYNILS